MNESRRSFIAKSVGIAAAAACASTGVHAAEDIKGVGACGISCMTCPAMAAGKCKGCASGTKASDEMVQKKNCKVLACAKMKQIDYCPRDCKGFTMCSKIVGKPYAKEFIAKLKAKLN